MVRWVWVREVRGEMGWEERRAVRKLKDRQEMVES